MVVPSVAGLPRSAEDTSPPQVTPLPVCDDAASGPRLPATAVVRAPCSTATTERERWPSLVATATRSASDGATSSVTVRHRLRFRAFRSGALHQLPVDGEDPHIVQHRLARHSVRRRNFRTFLGLCQDEIDAVARPDQTGQPGNRIDTDGDGAHAWPKHRGQETTVARVQCVGRQHDVAFRQIAPDHGAQQFGARRRVSIFAPGGTSFGDRWSAARSSGFNRVPTRSGRAATRIATLSFAMVESVCDEMFAG